MKFLRWSSIWNKELRRLIFHFLQLNSLNFYNIWMKVHKQIKIFVTSNRLWKKWLDWIRVRTKNAKKGRPLGCCLSFFYWSWIKEFVEEVGKMGKTCEIIGKIYKIWSLLRITVKEGLLRPLPSGSSNRRLKLGNHGQSLLGEWEEMQNLWIIIK